MALADSVKKIPVPVWLGLGGAGLGLGWAYFRDKNAGEQVPVEPAPGSELGAIDDEYYGTAGYGVDYGVGSAGPVYASPGGAEGIGEVGGIGQTALETIGDLAETVIGTIPGIIEAARPDVPYDGIPQSTPPTPVAVNPAPPVVQQPKTTPATRPNGYKPGGQVGSGTVTRNFNGASGWTEIATPDNRFRDFHVAYPNGVLQRWRGWGTGNHVPKAKRGDWDKIWEGRWR